jgi:hypothetical protein
MKYNEVIVTAKTFYSYQTFSVLYDMFWSTWLKHVLKYTQYLTTIQSFVVNDGLLHYTSCVITTVRLDWGGGVMNRLQGTHSAAWMQPVLHPCFAPSDCWIVPVIPWIRNNILCCMEEDLYHVQGEYWSCTSPKNGKPRKHNTTVIRKLYFCMHNFNQFNTQFLT